MPARWLGVLAVAAIGLTVTTFGATSAAAAEPAVGLGTTDQFAVLAGEQVTNTGASVLVGFDLGVSPGTAVTGFPPGIITSPGTSHVTDAVAAKAQLDATTAFDDAAGRSVSAANSGLDDLVGKTLQPGVYQGDALSLSGTVTLDNNDVPDAVFIFQASSTLITSSSSVVKFTNADHPSCNVFWEVGSSATLGTGSSFVGTLLAKTTIAAATGATIQGRLLASTGEVTLDTNTITRLDCAPTSPPSSSTPPSSTPPPTTSTPAPVTSRSVVVPPVSITPPPRDVTSGRTVPVTLSSPHLTTAPLTSVSGATGRTGTAPSTSTNQTRAQSSSTNSTTETSLTAGFDTGSGSTPGLAVTGPPVVPMTLFALVLLTAGWALIVFGRTHRGRIGQHRA